MTMSLGIAGQNLEFGMKSQGKKSWLEYQGAWYALDAKNAKTLDKQAQTGAAPTEQLKSMGVDPSTWGATYQLVGTEDLNGVQVYHIKATADAQKLADSLTKAAEDPSLSRSSAARAASSASSARASRRTSSRPRSSARASRTRPWTTGSASTTSSCTRRSSRASMDTSARRTCRASPA